jgi:hypothetical protein
MSDDLTPIQRAEEAVCEQIARRAGNPTSDEQRAGELKKLAEGVAAMKFGAQGGAYSNAYDGKYVSSTQSDDHRTNHAGEERRRPPAGFSG